jgi:hypothetical protein
MLTMTETSTETADPRAWVQFHSDEAAPVILPGYLNALPGIVAAGDVFSIDAEFLDEITAGGDSERFTVAEQPKADSPNEALTKAELAEKAGNPDLVDQHDKGELVTIADEVDRMHPQPVGGDDVAYVAPFDEAVATAAATDAGNAGTDTEDDPA